MPFGSGTDQGPEQDPPGTAGGLALSRRPLRKGRPPRICGDGRQTRDYVYVGDVVAAVLAALGRDGGVYNVGTGVETSVLELYEAVQQSAGVRREAEHADARAGELQRSVLDVSLAARELGWRPELGCARAAACGCSS